MVGAIMALCLLVAVPAMGQKKTAKPWHHIRTKVEVPAENGKKKKDSNERPLRVVTLGGDTVTFANRDSIEGLMGVEILPEDSIVDDGPKVKDFNPDPTTALWWSALCPGLGQVYNRRYWKLPIVVGAFVGLSYGMSWNNRMYNDYSKAYRDAMDNDPNTRSYMDFYPPTVKESDLDMDWLKKALKSKKNYYRRYRDICIFSMIGVYALSILDAYVDASLAHFDVSPDLTMQVRPAVMQQSTSVSRNMAMGLQCSLNF